MNHCNGLHQFIYMFHSIEHLKINLELVWWRRVNLVEDLVENDLVENVQQILWCSRMKFSFLEGERVCYGEEASTVSNRAHLEQSRIIQTSLYLTEYPFKPTERNIRSGKLKSGFVRRYRIILPTDRLSKQTQAGRVESTFRITDRYTVVLYESYLVSDLLNSNLNYEQFHFRWFKI